MMSAVMFPDTESAVMALDQMFPGLEAVICDCSEDGKHLIGILQKFEGERQNVSGRISDGPSVLSFRLNVMAPLDENKSEAVSGFQIGLPGEYCGSMDQFRSFQEIANRMSEYWEVRRV
jgi:hypothetical protein